jgi:hypothetical protein
VYKKNQKHYALKVLNKAQLVKKKVIRSAMVEKDALIALGTQSDLHPGIIRLHHCFQDTAHLCELTNAPVYSPPLIFQILPWIWPPMVI